MIILVKDILTIKFGRKTLVVVLGSQKNFLIYKEHLGDV